MKNHSVNQENIKTWFVLNNYIAWKYIKEKLLELQEDTETPNYSGKI